MRRAILSSLTIVGLGELRGRYASYESFAKHLRAASSTPAADLRELSSRMCFRF